MRLTTKGRYGVRAVVNLAASANNRPISISQIASQEDLSPEFLEQIFFKLKRAGLIRSIRGPKGGFVLNRKPTEITVKTILDAVGEPLYPAPCAEAVDDACERKASCSIAPLWQNFYGLIDRYLSSVSLQDLMERRERPEYAGLSSGQDFSI